MGAYSIRAYLLTSPYLSVLERLTGYSVNEEIHKMAIPLLDIDETCRQKQSFPLSK